VLKKVSGYVTVAIIKNTSSYMVVATA